MDIKIKNRDCVKLLTGGKYCEEDINILFDDSTSDLSVEDGLLSRTLTTYRNDRITSLGAGAFMQFPTLKILILSNVVTMNGSCFSGGIKFDKLEMPKLETIGTKGFDYISFPELKAPLKSISGYGLIGNGKLERLIITQDEVVCKLSSTNSFQATTIATSETMGFVYVPDALVEQYKIATNWSTFAHKIKPISELEEE